MSRLESATNKIFKVIFDRLAQNSGMIFAEGFPFARYEHPKGFHVMALRFPFIEEGMMLILEKPNYRQSMVGILDRIR